MGGYSTMFGIYKEVRLYFDKNSGHLVYIDCRNHRLAICFTHLVPKYKDFVRLNSLLLNLFLLLKISTVKSAMLDKVQTAYGITSLKLIKTVMARWLSHRKAVKSVLDHYESLVEALGCSLHMTHLDL